MTPERIADAQRRLGLRVTGVANDELWHAVRGFQMEAGLMVTGVLDEVTYHQLWERRLLRDPGPITGEGSDPGPE